ncbi:unnamed protein product [Caenorhabditis nigoni]
MSVHEAEVAFLQLFKKLEIQRKPPKTRFPLLKLPRVALLECIENLDVLEIILFSLLSKRAKTIAKLVRWTPLDIRLKSDLELQIQLKCSINPCREWIIEFNEGKESHEYPYFESYLTGPIVEHLLFLRDNGNAIEDSRQMTEHICELFRSPISGFHINEESDIEWIIKFQPTPRNVWIWRNAITSVETLHRSFKSLQGTDYFHLESVTTVEEFQYTEPVPFRSINIRNSYWLTLPSILNGNNSNIRLHDSKLTPKDINTILKEWLTGSKLRNLEFLRIHTITRLDADEVYKDLNLTVGDENDGRPRTVKIHDDYIYQLPEAETVRNLIRNDGTILSIFNIYLQSEFAETKTFFTMQVWNRQN